MMTGISTDTRVILWIVAAIAGGLSAIVGNVLAINIVYFFSKKGRRPTQRPIQIWMIFFIGLAMSISFGALAAFAPALPNQVDTISATTATPANPPTDIRLIPIEGQNITVKLGAQSLSLGEVISLNAKVTVIFKILNNGSSPATIKSLVIGARGPGVGCKNKNVEKWSAPDNPFPASANITLEPGKEYEYQGIRAFYQPGKYFLEPIMQGPNGNWGGIQPFSCIDITVK